MEGLGKNARNHSPPHFLDPCGPGTCWSFGICVARSRAHKLSYGQASVHSYLRVTYRREYSKLNVIRESNSEVL
jgi:hypothetical protein